jgi:transposase
MTAKITARGRNQYTQDSLAAQARFLRAIKAGRITSGVEAARMFSVGEATIWNWVANARRNGQRIATSTGGAWCLLSKGNGK